MATHWKISDDEILREFGYSESGLRRDLLTLNKAIEEHEGILREAGERRISPKKLLDWILSRILSEK